MVDYIYGHGDPAAAITKMCDPEVKIVSLTVTEKGYSQDISTGDLDFNNTNVKHDLENISTPKTAIGYIVSALGQRKNAGNKSFTVLCCDNL